MTPKLGDLFPQEKREEQAKRLFTKGAVLRLHSSDINNPKIKRLIIIGFDDEQTVGKVYINSAPQSSYSQLGFGAEERDYLDHDSYVDCSQIYEGSYSYLIECVQSDLSCHIGTLSDKDMADIERELRVARTIPTKQKRRFGLI
jgi:hypothetical protein